MGDEVKNEIRLIDAITRRNLLQGGMFAAAAALLGGCQSGQRVAGNIPDPIWPDKERGFDPMMPQVTPPSALEPAPTPRGPSTYSGPSTMIIPRARWTREGVIESRVYAMNGIARITVHHEGNSFVGSTDINAIARRLSNIREGHIRRRPEPFADIGYHYVIDPAGRVWEGRQIRFQGAHVEKKNEHNLGIMVMGNFEEQRPTTAQFSTLERFVAEQMRRYQIPVSRVYTHKEIGETLCPGRNLQRWMLAQRSPAGAFALA
jgi:hypothetical protein